MLICKEIKFKVTTTKKKGSGVHSYKMYPISGSRRSQCSHCSSKVNHETSRLLRQDVTNLEPEDFVDDRTDELLRVGDVPRIIKVISAK